jgi:hypothetical protein
MPKNLRWEDDPFFYKMKGLLNGREQSGGYESRPEEVIFSATALIHERDERRKDESEE